MFKTRLLSGMVLVCIALILLLSGGDILWFALIVVSGVGMRELYRVLQIEEKSCLNILGQLSMMVYYVWIRLEAEPDMLMFVLGSLIVLMAAYVFSYPKYKTEQVFAVYFGIFYVAVMLSCIYLTRMLPKGAYIVWLIFICSWGSDTCAYCVGMLIGKHKMSPKLSPKKSIEGAVGGVLGSILLTLLYTGFFKTAMQITTMEMWILAAISGIGALISMVGDLAASAIKRNYGIKDYGTLIPGHGGILDRFDSVIFTAPIVYCLANYIV